MTEIRECPFCGEDQSGLMLFSGRIDGCTYVHCAQCDTSGPKVFNSRKAAIAAWNRRVDDRYTATPTGRAMLKDGD